MNTLAAFRHHLHARQRLYDPSGCHRHLLRGARHVVTFLETVGVVAPAIVVLPPPPEPELLDAFRHWMRTHRGTTEATLHTYRRPILARRHTLGEQLEGFAAQALRTFVLDRAGRRGIACAKTLVKAVRRFLRCLMAVGRCPSGLDHALPTLAHWRLTSWPRYLPAETVERVLASGDLTTPIGVRDRAVLWLLARLGLRAGDVAAWQWRDLDWPDGTLRVAGKNRRAARLPLPPDVGEASLCDGEHQRPDGPSAYVFLTTLAPIHPISPKTVTKLAARALHRAHLVSPIDGAHVFRHAAATAMLRQGVSLPSIGALRRHASVETTAHYAKGDVPLLHTVVSAWPEVPPC